ncbi:MAG: hypothetical protein GF346_07105 [Candidatus Eisenbacteria bacterium]|nr:hypothetical protein [Candidatus Latescibacterota bacterium]MBD3302198.1 hypothetical protein [Candidatus Eisenbacteria bacterium]
MAPEPSIRRYRCWYRKLLRFYPKPYRKHFGEGMEQTFADLLRERAIEGSNLTKGVLWMFGETSVAILRENVAFIMMKMKNILRLVVVTGLLLLIPLVAMQLTDEVVWSPADFILAGILLFGAGLASQRLARKGIHVTYRVAAGVALGAALLLIWANLAVGLIGPEDNPANLLYGGVLLIGFAGAAIARLKARGMAWTLFAMALVQASIPMIALILWKPQVTPTEGGLDAVFVTVFFVFLFLLSGFLFRRASAMRGKGLTQIE